MTLSAALSLLLSAVPTVDVFDSRATGIPVQVSHDVTIWPKGSLARIKLCSRHLPFAITARTWTPTWRDVARIEATLPLALGEWRTRTRDRYFLTPGQFEQTNWESQWSRNYFGVFRKGRRHLYVDFARLPMKNGFSVCDGGSSFFGIEIDSRSGTIVTLDTNGLA